MFLVYKLIDIIEFDVTALTTAQYYIVVFVTCVILLLFSLLLNYLLDKGRVTRILFLGKK